MILPVVLAGGTGSRLWPLSRELYPKQFLKILGEKTMLQMTLERLKELNHQTPFIVCNEELRFLVAEQLKQISMNGVIILEPCRRNTAPAIALSALIALETGDDPDLLVLPADHMIKDDKQFHKAIHKAQAYLSQGNLVAFGIVPNKPEVGFGYLKANKEHIEHFVEKPSLEHARAFLKQGDYYWNSGMFMFRASSYLKELRKYRGDIYQHCLTAVKQSQKIKDYFSVDNISFSTCPAESIDYAVMEKTAKGIVVPLDCEWSDIGSWASIWDISEKDAAGNIEHGDVFQFNSQNNLIHNSDKLVVTIGIENTVVVNTKDALLVMSKSAAQNTRQVVDTLALKNRKEVKLHREVHRPWGKFDSLEQGARYQVKHLTIQPGEKLSTQMHYHRAEHWIIVSGSALITKDDDTFLLIENESTYIPIGTVHTLKNPGIIPLELIEVQTGTYLGEDDIVRFEDEYGRCSSEKDSDSESKK